MANLCYLIALVLSLYFSVNHVSCLDETELIVMTVATENTDGYKRLQRSAKVYGLELKTLGLGKEWKGGDVTHDAGGGFKVKLLQEELQKHKDNKNLVILFVDGYDVILTETKATILKSFESFKANVVFGAEDFCWPDKNLKEKYPRVFHGYKFLNSGGFIGYAPQLHQLVQKPIENLDDDQLYYTNAFLNDRETIGIKLDTQAQIFQNLNGASADVSLDFKDDDTKVINNVYHNTPAVVHGNGATKSLLNSLGNYLAKSWTKTEECLACKEERIDLSTRAESEYPKVLVGVFIEKPSAFLEDLLDKIDALNYPKNRIDLFIHNKIVAYEEIVSKWVDEEKQKTYRSVKYISSEDNVKEWHARNLAVTRCLERDCDLLFFDDSDFHVDNPETLKLLISYNRSVLGAIATRIGKAWSTFWGAVTDDGYYARSTDYMDIINGVRRGIWNVPYISGAYVIWRRVLENESTKPKFIHKLLDADMAMAANFRSKFVFMYAVNLDTYGHLVNNEAVSTEHLHNDLWQVAANSFDWERRYINPEYLDAINPDKNPLQPCPDVFWFPVFTPRFCNELIETMEHFGKWSGGKNEDNRLAGGYENVPTVDIHMNQIKYEQEFLYILKTYIKPLAEKQFVGYTSDARAIMNFVVRYRPDEQFFLRPHHDSSTYTINVGLNRPNIDYQGGGARFIRYNCSVVDTKVGWALMHPGRLTHYHEGLPTTNGTRYILVSFIDP